MFKRVFDLFVSSLGLLFFAPLFIVLAILIKLDSGGRVFFRQERVGRNGKIFRIHKFRTMVEDAEKIGPKLTVGSDARVTRVGKWIRKYKLDELAQLIDVWLGYMSLVGPRPEVPQYVAYYPKHIKELIFTIRPGITDEASIKYKDESLILELSSDPNKVYLEQILPNKLLIYEDYVKNRTFFNDLLIIFHTIFEIIRKR